MREMAFTCDGENEYNALYLPRGVSDGVEF